jgi:hypothetical protein
VAGLEATQRHLIFRPRRAAPPAVPNGEDPWIAFNDPATGTPVQLHARWLAQRFPQARRYVYGHSLGGAIAVQLAAGGIDAAGLIVEGRFTSIPEVYDTLKWHWLPLRRLITQHFDSVRHIAAVRARHDGQAVRIGGRRLAPRHPPRGPVAAARRDAGVLRARRLTAGRQCRSLGCTDGVAYSRPTTARAYR